MTSPTIPLARPATSPRHRHSAWRTSLVLVAALTLFLGLVQVAARPAHAQQSAAGADDSVQLQQGGPVGWAGQGGGTTGGAGGPTVTVTNQADLERYAAASGPYTIRVQGRITIQPFGREVSVSSNKTIIGVGNNAEIYQGGFRLIGVNNVIIRNLTIGNSFVPSDPNGDNNDYDALQIDSSRNIWIDHNRLTRAGDGLLDLRLDSDYVTVSWNIFEDHNKTFGIGWTPNVITKVTIHHNWFRRTHQRNPAIDNVQYGHIFNNYFQNVTGYGINPRGQARVVAENNYFQSVHNPLLIDGAAAELSSRGNVFQNTTGNTAGRGAGFNPGSHYNYSLTPANSVPGVVSQGAGPTL